MGCTIVRVIVVDVIIVFGDHHQLMSTAQKIAEIEAEMERTQKNKATSYHLGLLKAKLAKLKRELIEPAGGKKGGTAGEGFEVSKSGDARVGMIGFPSVGKSTLLTKLTGIATSMQELSRKSPHTNSRR
jgi:ribosome-interacting GTPase 1